MKILPPADMIREREPSIAERYGIVSCGANQLIVAILELAEKFRGMADAAITEYAACPQSPFILSRALLYGRFATDMEYLRDTRVPFLHPDDVFDIRIGSESYENFLRISKGQPYSLNNLIDTMFIRRDQQRGWFEIISAATDLCIPRKRRNKTARFTPPEEIRTLLKHQVHDRLAQGYAFALLQQTETGRDLLAQTAQYGYEYHFVDLRPFNLNRRDRGLGSAIGICYSEKEIYVDAFWEMGNVGRALVTAHEAAHALQFHRHLEIEKHKTQLARDGAEANAKQFTSIMEAHSIAMEYIVAAELLTKGVAASEVHKSVRGLKPEIINRLLRDPSDFLKEVSTSDVVRKGWQLNNSQTTSSPKIMREFARSIPPLCEEWVDPQMEEWFIESHENLVRRIPITVYSRPTKSRLVVMNPHQLENE